MATMTDVSQDARPETPTLGRPRQRRRPGQLALSVAVVCLGALVTGWAFQQTNTAVSVVAVKNTIMRGQQVSADDLVVVRVGVDPALRTVPAADVAGLVGQYAVTDIAAGTMLSRESLDPSIEPARSYSLVGVPVGPGQMPSVGLLVGDRVDVLATPTEAAVPKAAPPMIRGSVFHVGEPDDNGGITVDLLVADTDAGLLAAQVASGRVAIVLRSRER